MLQPSQNPCWLSCNCHLVIVIVIIDLSGPSHWPLFQLSFIFLIVPSYSLLFTSQRNNCSEGLVASYGNCCVSCCKETDPNPINPLIIFTHVLGWFVYPWTVFELLKLIRRRSTWLLLFYLSLRFSRRAWQDFRFHSWLCGLLVCFEVG